MFRSLERTSGWTGNVAMSLSYLLHWTTLGLMLIHPPPVETVPPRFPPGFFARRAPDPPPPPPAVPPDGCGFTGPMTFTADMQQPVLIHRVEPDISKLRGLTIRAGVLILEAVIETDGSVRQIRVLRPLHPLIDQASIDAIGRWRYRPAMLRGCPMPVVFTVTVRVHPR